MFFPFNSKWFVVLFVSLGLILGGFFYVTPKIPALVRASILGYETEFPSD